MNAFAPINIELWENNINQIKSQCKWMFKHQDKNKINWMTKNIKMYNEFDTNKHTCHFIFLQGVVLN